MENNEIEKKIGNRKNKAMILVGGLVVLSLVLVGVAFYLMSNPKTVMLQSLSKLTNNTKDILGESNNELIQNILKEDKVGVTADVKVGMGGNELFQFNFSYLENKKDEKSSFDLSLLQNNQSLVEANGILANNRLYLKVKDIMDYYYTELEYMSLLKESNTDDYQKVLDFIYEAFKEELNEKDIKKTKETITLNEKNKKVTKLSYAVTKDMISNILDKISNDKEMVRIFAGIAEVEEQQVKEELNVLNEDISVYEDNLFYYNVYYYGFNNIVLYEIADDMDQLQVYQYDDIAEVVFIEEDIELFRVKATEKNSGYDLEGKFDNYSFTGTYVPNGDKTSLDLELIVEGMIISVSLDQTIETKDNYKVTSDLVVDVAGNEIEVNMTVLYVTSEEVDTSLVVGAKDFEAMTDEELQTIMTNLQKHPLFSSLIPYFTTDYSSLMEDDTIDLEDDTIDFEDATIDLEEMDSTLTY